MEIKKKCWPEFFELVKNGKKNTEVRLADFELRDGDTLVLEEWDPKTKKYTGRKIKKKCRAVFKINLAKFNSIEDIQRHGHYLIELE